MMRSMAVWLGAVLMAGGLWGVSIISQGVADEPAAPSNASGMTGGAAGKETGESETVPPMVEGELAPPPEASEVQEQTVSLTQAVHFTDATGQDVVVGPGSYRVDAEGTNRIHLLPAGTAEAVVLDAVSFTHQETVERPVSVAIPDPEQPDMLHLALVSPGGMGLEAIGTYSGVKPRAETDFTIRSRGTIMAGKVNQYVTATAVAAPPPVVQLAPGTSAPSVVIYENPNFGGRSQTLGVGGYIFSDLNDMASSIRVSPGLVALLYEHVDAGGGYGLSVDLLEDRPDLAQVNFNDKLSYVCVFSRTTPEGFIWARASVQNGQFVAGHWERQRVGGTPANTLAVVAPPLSPHPASAPPASCGGGPIVIDQRTSPTFSVMSYGGKCLDFGPSPQIGGAPVFIYTCNGTIAQQVVVQEINARHEVILRAGTLVIGVRGVSGRTDPPVLSRGVGATSEAPLELQNEENRQTVLTSGAGQIFALDGDSIILAADRTRVVKVLNNRGTDRTPLVLGSRDLADNEFWTFVATDKSGRYPTGGFVRVATTADFVDYISGNPMRGILPAGPGTVIDVDPNASINVSNQSLPIPDGVTIRSNRRGTNLGAELFTADPNEKDVFHIKGHDVRITGLRLRGSSGSTDEGYTTGTFPKLQYHPFPEPQGIWIHENPTTRSIIIDHNDMSDFRGAPIYVTEEPELTVCVSHTSRPHLSRVARNFIHRNRMQGAGYGVNASHGGYPLIEGNTFVSNRHAIKAGGEKHTGYRAWDNLVLSEAPLQHGLFYTQDFDMHGTDDSLGESGVGGDGGQYIEIARNTFLGDNRENFDLRGAPCFPADFHHNVSLRSLDDAVACTICAVKGMPNGRGVTPLPTSTYINTPNNHFNSGNPTTRLGVGDFDGDGRDDLFLATGAAWYYAPAGMAEWRFLNAQPDGIGTLLFGDFDADGRTDVFTQHGTNWDVSWGGASQWDTINGSGPILGNAAIGDFVGDQRADVFYSDGQAWYISDGGVGMFAAFVNRQGSGFRVADLGFGDFNGDGKTDVVGVVGGQWKVSFNATQPWANPPLRPALTGTMAGLMIADFNADGLADIATAELGYLPSGKSVTPFWNWKVSWAGKGGWTPLRTVYAPPVGVGRFDATRGADILVWESTSSSTISILSSGVGAPIRYSPQEMR